MQISPEKDGGGPGLELIIKVSQIENSIPFTLNH